MNTLTWINTIIAFLIHDGGDISLSGSECGEDGVGRKGFSIDINDTERQVCGWDGVVRRFIGVQTVEDSFVSRQRVEIRAESCLYTVVI